MSLFPYARSQSSFETRRNIVTVLFDTSKSMGWAENDYGSDKRYSTVDSKGRTPIEALQEEVPNMISALTQKVRYLDLAVGVFYGKSEGDVSIDWLTVGPNGFSLEPSSDPFLSKDALSNCTFPARANGFSPIPEAFKEAIDVTVHRMDYLRSLTPRVSIEHRPTVCIFTDGIPTNNDMVSSIGTYVKKYKNEVKENERIKIYGLGSHPEALSKLDPICGKTAIHVAANDIPGIVGIVSILSGSTEQDSEKVAHRENLKQKRKHRRSPKRKEVG